MHVRVKKICICVQRNSLIAYFGVKKSIGLDLVWILLTSLVQGLPSVFPTLARYRSLSFYL